MIPSERDADGWPIWPRGDASIFDSIRNVFESGDWGKYQSVIHSQCVDAVTRLMTPRVSLEDVSATRCAVAGDSADRPPEVRLCSSGSAGIELALRGSGATDGCEVVVAAYDYPGNFRTIELLGATPVLADVRAEGVTMDPESLGRIDGPAIKAVVVSHLYGELADMIAIRQICTQRNWILIEDACQVPGAGWWVQRNAGLSGDRGFLPVGTLADAAVLSFGGSKLLSAGNGGAVVTRNARLNARLRAFADRPSDVMAFSPLQCAALLPQLAKLDEHNQRRADAADRLTRWDWASAGATAISDRQSGQTQAYYKFAIAAKCAQTKHALHASLRQIRLPVGEGFRSMHGTSERRSRKPVSLDRSRWLGECCLVIDHRALLADELIPRLTELFSR